MSDTLNHDLISQLAGQGVDEVYLPPTGSLARAKGSFLGNHVAKEHVREVAADYFESDSALFGDKVSETSLITEKPVHRMMIYLHAAGATAGDIAAQTGFSRSAVTTVLRQPWARQRLVQILNETGRDKVKQFLTTEVAPSLEVLREIRDDTKLPAQARISSAKEILDRALGKSTVHIESKSEVSNVPAEAARLDAELAAVRKQLEAKGALTEPSPN